MTGASADFSHPEPTITSINLNGKLNVDLEVIQWPDGRLSLPVKYLATLLDLSPQQAYESKAVTFTDPVSSTPIRIDLERQQITQGETLFEQFAHPIITIPVGLFSQNDLYIDKELLEQFFGITLEWDTVSQSIALVTNRKIKALIRMTNETSEDDEALADGKTDPANQVIQPTPSDQVIDTISLSLDSSTFQEMQRQPVLSSPNPQISQFFNLGSTLLTEMKGHLLGMPYSVSPRWLLQNKAWGVSDIQWLIEKKTEKHLWAAGSLSPGLSPLVAPLHPIWGVQVASHNAVSPIITPNSIHQFKGEAKEKGKIVLERNGVYIKTTRPRDGKYEFDQVVLEPERLNHVRILQHRSDGSEVVLMDQLIPYFSKTLNKGEKAYTTFLGRVPYQFALPGMGQQGRTLPQSNKWVFGGRYFAGLSDKTTLGVSLAMDRVLGRPLTSTMNQLLLEQQLVDLTGYSTYRRDPNLIQGGNIGITLQSRLSSHWSLNTDISQSYLGRLSSNLNTIIDSPLGRAGSMSLRYDSNKLQGTVKLFRYDTNFYTPNSLNAGNLYDRQGLSVEAGGRLLGSLLQGSWEHYLTNLNERLEDGKITVNKFTGSIYRKLNKNTEARVAFNFLSGSNLSGELGIQNLQAELHRSLPQNMKLRMTYTRANQEYLFNPVNPLQLAAVQSQTALNTALQTELLIPLPKRFGTLQLQNRSSRLLTLFGVQGNLRWRRFIFQFLAQKGVGEQALNTFGLGIGHEWKNGKRVDVHFNFNSTNLPSLDPLVRPGLRSSRSFQIQFSDTLAHVGGHWKSMGRRAESTGMLLGQAFLDLNQNGKRDAGEPGVPNIPVRIDGKELMTTNSAGEFSNTEIAIGEHPVSFDYDTLPINLTPTTTVQKAMIAAGKRTRVQLGLIVTPGSVSGKVRLKDVSGNPLKATDIIVTLLDEKGTEIKFTYTDPQGDYSIQDIAPGKYRVCISANQVKQQHLQVQNSEYHVDVPIDYKQFYDKIGIDFDILQLKIIP